MVTHKEYAKLVIPTNNKELIQIISTYSEVIEHGLKERLSEFVTLTDFLCSLEESITPQGMKQIQTTLKNLLRDSQKQLDILKL
jgi:hypothetical protein